jgi:methyl-accepting chemotaxis protein
MKKKIFIALALVCLIFIAGGAYIITTIETATSKLDNLIMLHQVEILREHLLIRIKNVQSDLYLIGTRHEKRPAEVLANINNLKMVSTTCFDCHHRPDVVQRLKNLDTDIEFYDATLNRILTKTQNRTMMEKAGDTAFRTAQNLEAQVDNMVHIANSRLADKTNASLNTITVSKRILYALVVITPFVAAGLCFVFIREFAKPVKQLLKATRKLQSGDLNYRIEGLKDEFGEVATSFNEMSRSLPDPV